MDDPRTEDLSKLERIHAKWQWLLRGKDKVPTEDVPPKEARTSRLRALWSRMRPVKKAESDNG